MGEGMHAKDDFQMALEILGLRLFRASTPSPKSDFTLPTQAQSLNLFPLFLPSSTPLEGENLLGLGNGKFLTTDEAIGGNPTHEMSRILQH